MKMWKALMKLLGNEKIDEPVRLSVEAKFPENELLARRQQKARQALGDREVKAVVKSKR